MSAKRDDYAKIQEIYDVVMETQRQMSSLGVGREAFLNPSTDTEDLVAEGLLNRVLRVTEEAGHLSEETSSQYGFERAAVNGVRNRLAHAYGEVDREIIWEVLEGDFPKLLEGCRAFCDDRGIALE